MTETIIFISVLISLCLAALAALKWRGRQPAVEKKSESFAQLEEVLRAAELSNSSFFQSLELVQKNLESLLARAENAEQRLRALMLQPGSEKKEQYAAAALLLGDGQEPQRVATMLNLPLPQVQIVRELQKMTIKEKKIPARRSMEEPSSGREPEPQAKVAAQREKTAAGPMRLVDVIRKAASEAAKQENQLQRFNGVHV